MPTPAILHGPEALTVEWLTSILRARGVIEDARVTRFACASLGEGVGILGQVLRVSLDYEGDASRAPQSLIAKFPSPVPENRAIGHGMGHYAAEIDFYDKLAHQVALRIPHPYHTALNRETGDFTLLLEDLTPAMPGDQVAGSTLEQAAAAVGAIARFQAAWWGRVDTPALAWMRRFDLASFGHTVQRAYLASWEPCLAHFGDDWTPMVIEAGKRLGPVIPTMMMHIASAPCTILHGDYRLDNLFFGDVPGGAPIAVVDWQISSKGRGPYDVGYYMSQSVPTPLRGEIEEALVRDYHRQLVEAGVRGYAFDDAWRDYRYAIMFCLAYPVIVLGSMDLTNTRGVALGRVMLQRSVCSIDDLNAGALLPD
jgi:hypothetical protein